MKLLWVFPQVYSWGQACCLLGCIALTYHWAFGHWRCSYLPLGIGIALTYHWAFGHCSNFMLLHAL
eukprot:6456391-Amphidinium_carterae.1